MGWVFLLIGLGLVALEAVILTRTLNLSSKQLQVEAAPKASIDAEAIAERLARAVRFRTVSHQDPALVKGETFAEFHHLLSDIINGLTTDGFVIRGVWENPRPDTGPPVEQLEPGSEAHRQRFIPFGLSVVAQGTGPTHDET